MHPIETLPYPFLRRLIQLLSAPELRNLQNAAGRNADMFKPIIWILQRLLMDVEASSDERLRMFSNGAPILSGDYLPAGLRWFINYSLRFRGINWTNFRRFGFRQVYFEVSNLSFYQCELSDIFIDSIGKLFNRVYNIKLVECTTAQHLNLSTIFKSFPSVKTVECDSAPSNWLWNLESADVTQLRSLDLTGNNFASLFSFTGMELLAFANKQEQCFHCFLTIKSSPEDNIAGIMDEVKLKMSTGFNEHANDGQVHVTCGDTTLCFVPKTFA